MNVKFSHVITALGLVVQRRGLDAAAAVSDIESTLHWSCDSDSSLSDPVKSELKTPKVLLVFVSGSFTRLTRWRRGRLAAAVNDIGLVEVVTLILVCVMGYKMMIAFYQDSALSWPRSVYVISHWKSKCWAADWAYLIFTILYNLPHTLSGKTVVLSVTCVFISVQTVV